MSTQLTLDDHRSSHAFAGEMDSAALYYLDEQDEDGVRERGRRGADGYRTRKVLFVNCSVLDPPITVEVAVALGLCKSLRLDTRTAAAVACLIASSTQGRAQQVLGYLRIGSDVATMRERLRGIPGERIFQNDQDLLELKPFRIFRSGEVVAYQARQPSTPTLTNTSTPTKLTDSVGDEVEDGLELRYGRVVSSGETEEGGLRRVVVRAGEGVVTLLSTQVYSFKSAREYGKVTSALSSGSSSKQAPTSAWSLSKTASKIVNMATAGAGARGGGSEGRAGRLVQQKDSPS